MRQPGLGAWTPSGLVHNIDYYEEGPSQYPFTFPPKLIFQKYPIVLDKTGSGPARADFALEAKCGNLTDRGRPGGEPQSYVF